ncbi:MAG: hypothetical protein HC850_14305 [Rhodomicrobium sp.]|nr:hypothetical protein [Rhodomicrobium sp.]
MGGLGYMPQHAHLSGSDHFVVVLGVESERVRMHDPEGYPYAVLPASEFLRAWKAERVRYAQVPYTMRTGFRQARHPAREEMIARTIAVVRTTWPPIRASFTTWPPRMPIPRSRRRAALPSKRSIAPSTS